MGARVRCWGCNKWVLPEHAKQVEFRLEGTEANTMMAPVCLICYGEMTAKDIELENRRQEDVIKGGGECGVDLKKRVV